MWALGGSAVSRGGLSRCAAGVPKSKLTLNLDGVGGSQELNVWISFVEIYNEHVRDLLVPTSQGGANAGGDLRVMDHPQLGVCMPGLTEVPCESPQHAKQLMEFGSRGPGKLALSAGA